MRAWSVETYGPWEEVLQPAELPAPEPGPGQVLLRVGATGVSFALILRIAGKYQVQDPLPFVPGTDVAGEVVQAGPGVEVPPGARLMVSLPRGGLAEYAVADAAEARPVPEGMPDAAAAAFLNPYPTAYVGLVHQAGLQAGEWLLVHGAAGGVGLAAVQVGRALGARVIAVAGGPEKAAAAAEAGAHHAIDHRAEDFVAAVSRITDGHGADVVYDPVGGEVFDRSRRCIAFRGRLLVVGFAGGRIPTLEMNRVLLRTFSVTGFTLHAYRRHAPELLARSWEALLGLYAAGHLRPHLHAQVPLSRVPEALGLVARREAIGKVVVVPG